MHHDNEHVIDKLKQQLTLQLEAHLSGDQQLYDELELEIIKLEKDL